MHDSLAVSPEDLDNRIYAEIGVSALRRSDRRARFAASPPGLPGR